MTKPKPKKRLTGLILEFLGRFMVLLSLLCFVSVSPALRLGGIASAISIFFFGSVLIGFGLPIRRHGKQLRMRLAHDVLAEDCRAPVLYLRPFTKDYMTSQEVTLGGVLLGIESEEEQLAFSLQDIGPVVAIGVPGELLPTLGAARMYTGDEEWKDTVFELIKKSRLIVLLVGDTDGFWWEVEKITKSQHLEKSVFLLPIDSTAIIRLFQHLSSECGKVLPLYEPKKRKRLSISQALRLTLFGGELFNVVWERLGIGGLLSFDSSGQASIDYVQSEGLFRFDFRRPLTAKFRATMYPVMARLGIPYQRPTIRYTTVLFILFLALCFLGTGFAVLETVF